MNERWAPARKRKLGDVWHRYMSGQAHCDYRIQLAHGDSTETPPADAYKCKRCVACSSAYLKSRGET